MRQATDEVARMGAGPRDAVIPTQMHERYLCPAVVLVGVYAVWKADPWAYALVSIGSFLNMEAIRRAFWMIDRVQLIHPRAVALVVLAAYLVGLAQLVCFCRARDAPTCPRPSGPD